jgi:uncharacterized protein with PIN domain
MRRDIQRTVRILIMAAAVMGSFTEAARAQSQEYAPDFRTYYNKQLPPTNMPPSMAAPPQVGAPNPSFTSVPSAAPVVPYNPYAVQYNGPAGGYLTGASDVIGAQGQLMKDQQTAFLQREQVQQAKIDTRRKNFDETNYERANTPTLDEEREFSRIQNVRRSRNDPPVTEIWSGTALNSLLTNLQIQAIQGPTVPLDPEILRQVNFTTGATGAAGGSIGLFKNGGKLEWPPALEDDAFTTLRNAVSEETLRVMSSAQSGALDRQAVRQLSKTVDKLSAQLRRNVGSIDPNDYIAAKRYVNDLGKGVQVLNQPDAMSYVSGKYQPRANTVSQLVNEMTSQGLKFAPAVPGQEAAYQSVQRSLAMYSQGVQQLVAR